MLFCSSVLHLGLLTNSYPTWFTHHTGKRTPSYNSMQHFDNTPRYDLNALFAKAFGDFTVNVQGLSRVNTTRSHNLYMI